MQQRLQQKRLRLRLTRQRLLRLGRNICDIHNLGSVAVPAGYGLQSSLSMRPASK